MILSRVSIQRPVLASMMSLALILFGVIGLQRLPVRELPDIDPPIVSVITVYPGANAAVVETEVTERLEEIINSVEGIKTLTSESREQVSNVTIEFDLGRDIDLAAQDVRDRVARARGSLPEEIEEPIISKQDADAFPVMWIGLNSDRHTTAQLSALAENQIKNRFQTITGVSSVMLGGEKRFAIRLWLDSERMAAHQITVVDVQTALRRQNVELPSGRVENLDREMTIQTRGELKSPEEFNQLVIRSDQARLVRLKDIGEALAGVENERTIARTMGKPCVFLGVVKQSKANTIEVAHGIKEEMERLRPGLPAGVNIQVNFDSSTYVEKAIAEVWETLGIAFVLVVLVIFVFLRDVRATLIPVAAIPVSIIGAFALLHAMGYSINILTMLAFVLSIGVVVDDAIVVLENIYRHIEAGIPPMQAALKAMEEISFAILAITFSLVAIFLPIAFQTSATGRLFIEFAVAVAGSVVISAFVALSLSPMMAARILRPVAKEKHGAAFLFFERALNWLSEHYRRALQWALRHRATVIGLGFLTFGLSVGAYFTLDKDFLPEEDQGRLMIAIQAPEGATSEYTDRQAKKIEDILASTPEVKMYGMVVSLGMGGPGLANQGFVFTSLKEERQRTLQQMLRSPGGLAERLMNEVPGAFVIPIVPKTISRSFSQPFQLVLQNQDLDALNKTAQAIATRLRGEKYLQNVRSTFEVNKPELRVEIDRNRAAALGVSIEEISRTLQILFGGLDISRIELGGKEYDVIAQLQRSSRLTPQSLDRLYVRNDRGELIQLSSIVRYETGAAPNVIRHYNRMRSATIEATPAGVPMGNAVEQVEAILRQELPDGFLIDWAGESRDLRDAGREFFWVLALAIIIVYMILASQFESLIHPFTVMLALPLAGLGAFGSLWLFDWAGKTGLIPPLPGMNINMFSQIGLLLLVGLVTKNSILLVDFANQRRLEGLPADQSMLEAGVVRLRPILMTAFSTIAGILPIAIGFGAGAESRRPLGIAVVGGMISSTFLTLFIIPVFYVALSRLVDRLVGRKPSPAVLVPGAMDSVVHGAGK